jgi:hypothetical protein
LPPRSEDGDFNKSASTSSDLAAISPAQQVDPAKSIICKKCRRGGMVDATDLKSVDFTVVPVRVRPAALFDSASSLEITFEQLDKTS